ncbi:DUF86 domain-containing protein [Candidatus Margulisiibacteriota bacterium]
MKNDVLYVRHILEAISKIDRYLNNISYTDLVEDDMRLDAVVRELEIIGEATAQLSVNFQQTYPEIPYKDIKGMRNFLIHEYFGVNTKIVWDTCKTDIFKLKDSLSSALKDFPDSLKE